MEAPLCRDHPSVVAATTCSRCGRAICALCLFTFSGSSFCPDCATAGPSAEERSKVFSGGLLSVGLAVAGFVGVVILLAVGAAGVQIPPGVDSLLSMLMFGSAIGGLLSGLTSRDGARRTGTLLPMIGVVANGLLVALLIMFVVIGMSE